MPAGIESRVLQETRKCVEPKTAVRLGARQFGGRKLRARKLSCHPPSVRVEEERSIAGFAADGYRWGSDFFAADRICCRPDTVETSPMPPSELRIALYQPDIPGNAGTILRLAACLGLVVDIVGPAGFDLGDRALRRAGMDYLEMAALASHADFAAFEATVLPGRRLVLLTTSGDIAYTDFAFAPTDVLLLGRESAGVPEAVHRRADARLLIPMPGGGRSLNVAVAAAMVVGEALRQCR
jgi:tRNA (cytidine/uridine-2'-O-)-methyltransferase